ncbi:MAG: amino acid adenylation domain-containing protein [Streptosporangiaceae bacterium]|jgi:amino acid adenylation domain-containing protein
MNQASISDKAVSPTTSLPPWVLPEAEPGRGSQSRPLPPPLRADPVAVRRWALAAWVAVLARCVGEAEVVTAATEADGTAVRVTGLVGETSWADLDGSLRRSPLAGHPHSILDLYGQTSDDAADLVIRADPAGGELSLSYDTMHVSHAAAERVLGYLFYAITAVASAPDAAVDLTGMIGDEERRYQLETVGGPRVNNGPDGFVPAFRARVAAHPHRPAIHHVERTLTYAELDTASDGIARHLLALGVSGGQAVAVVSARHIPWVTGILGVLKAGAVYLPVRPDFPASRVEDQLTRAECVIALADADGSGLMSAVSALGWPGAVMALDDLAARPAPEAELASPPLEAPAYVYFTSGSTGRPKGAVCRHDGMINHLWAKVDDHGLGPDDVVAQTASQCFDISLWQMCAPLLVGGASVIVDTESQLEVAAFGDLLASRQVTTLQIVPSYLEVLLAHLEAGRAQLPRLKSVSVTGEALNAGLVRRWFAAVPGVRLVNAYGATEVSDDTMHEILDGPPRRDLAIVNVGRPLRNMRTYVVDRQLRLMPLGGRGEIVFAGVCVGAGYINDPARTTEAFTTDPYFPGEGLYRSGDLGRWLPEGRLEFLGRYDDQLKLRGLRIEIGEIQAALLRVPGIEAAAVVPVGEGNSMRLVGFYVSEDELAEVDLHDLLSARLPEYMVPSRHFRLPELPLNDNGKTDKPKLRLLAGELASGVRAFEPPSTANERQLAILWAEVLGMAAGRVGRQDDFFNLGGTSLSAIHLLMRLDHRLSATDIMENPVLADQAGLLSATQPPPSGLVHELGASGPGQPVLVCLPDAGGNAINFQRLAEVAAGHVRVLAVELPGHDLARPDEELAQLPELTGRLARELAGKPALYLWGQGAGGVAALAAARALEEAGVSASGVMVAWDASAPGTGWSPSDEEVADLLRRRGRYIDVDGAAPGRLRFVARAWRHDWAQARHELHRLGSDPGLIAPIAELTLGDASPLLPLAAVGLTRHRLADTDSDVARYHPELILDILQRWRDPVGGRR